ncbi:hypothetical protein KJ567_02425, partial [Candidatus Bipolaricaulota bacterium]|nr:hypothetical protein [Candidatus Bipolaricaulota bacterium]
QITIRVDDDREVPELDETNNEMITQFYVGAAAADGQGTIYTPGFGKANLVVRDLVITPAETVDVGTTIRASASIANLGGESAGSFNVEILWASPSGASYTVRSQIIGSLGAGEVLPIGPVTIDTSLPMGLYQLVISVDVAHQIPEQNELDNELRRSVVVGGSQSLLSDITPVAVRFAPTSGQAEVGDQLFAFVTVRNLGTLASGPFGVSFATGSGMAYEAWGNLEPLQETEIAYAWRPTAAGDFTLSVTVDYANAVGEADESNNTITASYRATAPEVVRSEAIVQGDSAVSQLVADDATGRIYAAWASGLLTVVSPDGTTQSLIEPEAGVTITAVRLVDGSEPVAYLGTSIGTISKVDLASGDVVAEAFLMTEPIRILCPTAAGRVLAATEQRLVLLDSALTVTGQVSSVGNVLHLGYDEYRSTFYVATTTGLYAFDAALTPLCQSSVFLGAPTALAVGPGGIFVGTDAGVIYALGFCSSQNGSTFTMLDSWRYPRTGTLGGRVVSIAADPRDLDPIYVTDSAGNLTAMSLTGGLLWTYSGSGDSAVTMSSILTIEPRAGRVLVGDDVGTPYVIAPGGDLVFSVDATASQGSAVVSNFAVAETREQTAAGTRLVRSYYYGTQDGWIYKFDSPR